MPCALYSSLPDPCSIAADNISRAARNAAYRSLIIASNGRAGRQVEAREREGTARVRSDTGQIDHRVFVRRQRGLESELFESGRDGETDSVGDA